jgi:acyl dehydratase
MAIKPGWQGRVCEDFEVGDVYQHPVGRTVTQTDNIWFTLLTVNNNIRTIGSNQDGKIVIEFKRTILVYRRGHVPQVKRPAPGVVTHGSARD